jgi:tetratricopeptide (TPR) repeat protein
VSFQYTEAPGCEIPDSVARLAVAEFSAEGPPEGEGWGVLVAHQLAEAIDKAELPHRLKILGPQAAGAPTQPAGARLVVTDTASAAAFGESAGADAVAYGTVAVTWAEGPKDADAPAGQCIVTVRFVIDDVQAGRTLAAATFSRRYPPDDSRSSTAGREVVEELLAQCVDQFVAWLCPQRVTVNERLQVGRTRLVLDGNRLARAKQFAQALDCYLAGMKESPGDDGTVFNAGLMYEAMGQLDKAGEFYDQAALMRPSEQIDQARKRLQERQHPQE